MPTFTLPGGLVDAHFHAALDFEDRGLSRARLIELNLAALQRAGVLAARDVGQPPDAPWLEQGDRLVAARTLLAPPGRYFPGLSEPTPPERLVETAVAQVRAGARWVKVIADFPGPDGNWFEAPANYPPETLRAMADAVHAEGGRVAAHTTGTAAADAVLAGADTIEHGPTLDEERIEEMARRGTAWVPTLWAATRHVPPAALGPSPRGCARCWRSRYASASPCSPAPTRRPRGRCTSRSPSSSRSAGSRPSRRCAPHQPMHGPSSTSRCPRATS
jgi:hypothetical protein